MKTLLFVVSLLFVVVFGIEIPKRSSGAPLVRKYYGDSNVFKGVHKGLLMVVLRPIR
jgi:hypothetical protein